MSRIRVVCCFLFFLAACTAPSGDSATEIREASGVMRQSDSLLVVDDSVSGAYFSVSIAGQKGPLISLQGARVRRIPLPACPLVPDFEGVDRLADGRLVFLSERLRWLVGEDGLIAEYDSLLGEFANRGLEGLADPSSTGRCLADCGALGRRISGLSPRCPGLSAALREGRRCYLSWLFTI